MSEKVKKTAWSSRVAFIWVSIGATVGLGNLWRFPYAVGENGGGSFVLVYLIAVFSLAAPLYMAETLIGRYGRKSAPTSIKAVVKLKEWSSTWRWWGFLCMAVSTLVLSFYSVIAGFSLAYIFKSFGGVFDGADAGNIGQIFSEFIGNPLLVLMWHTIFAILTSLIVLRGIQGGIEKIGRIVSPTLLAVLVFLVIYAAYFGDAGATWDYLFTFDLSILTPAIILAAVGQAFFTMSIGSGGILTYGAYIDKPIGIGRASLVIAGGDTFVALLAGFAIFPILFANGMEASEGAGMAFVTLPIAFGAMPYGTLVGLLFFTLFSFAAITTSIALLEVSVAWFTEEGRMSRKKASLLITFIFWFLGLGTVFSFNIWKAEYPLSFIPALAEANIFGIINWMVSNLFLPVTGIFFSLLAGWFLGKDWVKSELGLGDGLKFKAWRFIVRYIAPIVVGVILIMGLY